MNSWYVRDRESEFIARTIRTSKNQRIQSELAINVKEE